MHSLKTGSQCSETRGLETMGFETMGFETRGFETRRGFGGKIIGGKVFVRQGRVWKAHWNLSTIENMIRQAATLGVLLVLVFTCGNVASARDASARGPSARDASARDASVRDTAPQPQGLEAGRTTPVETTTTSVAETKKKKPSFPGAKKVSLQPQAVTAKDGKLRLKVQLGLPPGSKINPSAPMGYLLETVNKKGPVDRSAPSKYQKVKPPKDTFELLVPVESLGAERLRLSMNFYHCQGDPATGICKTGAVILDIPFIVVAENERDVKDRVEIKYDIPKS